jgi:hypothetical protein
MKLRFSVRLLLIGTLVVALAAAFVTLRMQPARIAKQFQKAIERNDKDAVAEMITGPGIVETLNQQPVFFKHPQSWKFLSCEVGEQTSRDWLQGVRKASFVVEFNFRSEGSHSVASGLQECRYDVVISRTGAKIVDFTQHEAAVAVSSLDPNDPDDPFDQEAFENAVDD